MQPRLSLIGAFGALILAPQLASANPLCSSLPDPIVVAPSEPLKLAYRIFTHSGDVESGNVAEAWDSYAETVGRAALVAV